MKKVSNTVSACAYMLCMSEDSLTSLLKGEDVIRKLENEVLYYKSQLIKQQDNFKQEKQQIINILNK